jgi:hypothetical protein
MNGRLLTTWCEQSSVHDLVNTGIGRNEATSLTGGTNLASNVVIYFSGRQALHGTQPEASAACLVTIWRSSAPRNLMRMQSAR